MMNLLALALLTSTLAAGGFFSPPPSPPHSDPVLREGHRLIVVEYERELPADHPPPTSAADQFHEAVEALPNLGQGLSTPPATSDDHHGLRDKICDAYGNCKDRLSSLVGKGKDRASGASDKVSGKATELETAAKDAYNTASEKLHEKTDDAKDAVNKVNKKLTEKASDVKDTLKKEKEKLSEKAGDAVNKVADRIQEKADEAKYASSKVGEKISEKAAILQEGAKDAAHNISAAAGTVVATAEEAAANLTDILKRARDVAYDAAKYAGAPETVKAVAAVIRLLAVSAAYGASMWVTFVSSHVLARALPRQQFGAVQSRLYPVYFRTMAYGAAVALLAHWLRRGVAGRVQGYNLAAVLTAALLNLLYFEPKATKVMFERMKMEKEEGRGQDVADVVLETPVVAASTTGAGTQTATFVTARTGVMLEEDVVVKNRMVKLSRRLKKLNTYSSFLNILALMGLTWHLVHIGRCVQVNC